MVKKPTPIRRQSELRSEILDSLDLPIEDFHVPRWGKNILIKGHPTGHPRYVAYVSKATNAREEGVRKVVGAAIMGALDPDTSEALFNWSDEKRLREKHYNSLLLIAGKAFELAAGDGPIEQSAWDAIQFLIAYGNDDGGEFDRKPRWDAATMEHLTEVAVLIQRDIAIEADIDPDGSVEAVTDHIEPNPIEDAGEDATEDVAFDDTIEAEILEEEESDETDEVDADGPLAG